jgi:hypothetical protein
MYLTVKPWLRPAGSAQLAASDHRVSEPASAQRRTHRPEHIQAISLRQPQIEQHQVIRFAIGGQYRRRAALDPVTAQPSVRSALHTPSAIIASSSTSKMHMALADVKHICAASVPSSPPPLPAPMIAGLARAQAPLSSVSVVVQRIGGTQPLLSWNASEPMLPASTMTLVTTYAGLSILGPDYRWRTSAYRDGNVDASGVLHGNLYIQGHG